MFIMRPPNTEFPVGLQALVDDLPSDVVMVEVGSYAGESTAMFAKKVKTIYAIDPWVNYIEHNPTQDVPVVEMQKVEALFDEVVKKFPNIIKIKKYSNEAVNDFQDKSLDFVYIDANHEYKHVVEDIKLWLPKVKVGGTISGHDYVNNIYFDVMRAVKDALGCAPDKVYADYSWIKHIRAG